MKQAVLAVLVLVAMLSATILVSTDASAALTNSWQIETRNAKNETVLTFEARSTMNITVLPPQSIATGGVRSLIIYSQEQKNEIARYSLGYYSSGLQNNTAPRNISVNLGAFPLLIRGDTLLLQIRNPVDQIEFTTAVSIKEDIEALLEQQKQLLLGLLTQQGRDIDYLRWQIGELERNTNNYFMLFGVVIAFVIAYVTRDRWLNKKRKTEEVKSTTEFENFMEAFITERYQSGDLRGETHGES